MFEDCSAHVGCGFCCLVASCSDGLHTLNEKNINSRTLFHLMLAESRHCFNFATSEKNTLFEQRIGENNKNRNTLSDSRGKCHLREISF